MFYISLQCLCIIYFKLYVAICMYVPEYPEYC